MIEESYVSFETARMLKEAGFDVPCTSQYSEGIGIWNVDYPYNFNHDDFGYSRPTQALAARWLREVHKIILDIFFDPPLTDGNDWKYVIGEIDELVWSGDYVVSSSKYKTYEKAFEAGLQEAIKLIKK